MKKIKELSKEQVFFAVKNGEFSKDVIGSNTKVAVLMTQSWCGQWGYMKDWVFGISNKQIDIYLLVYDEVAYFEKFRDFKEAEWKNEFIPYIRYYRDGELIKETNYVIKDEFFEILEIDE